MILYSDFILILGLPILGVAGAALLYFALAAIADTVRKW